MGDSDLEEEDIKYEDFLRADPMKFYWQPFSVGSRLSERQEGMRKIVEAQKFFKTAIPSHILSNPDLLSKERYGDAPEERYVYKPPFNDENLPIEETPNNDEPSRYLRTMIDRLFEKGNASNLLIESHVNAFIEDDEERISSELKLLSDTEDNHAYNESLPEDVKLRLDMNEQELKTRRMEILDYIVFLKAQANPVICKSYVYRGPDIEAHIRETRSKFPPNVNVEWRKTEAGERVVVVSYTEMWKYDLKEVEYLREKYGDDLDSPDLEVDEEDVKLFQKIYTDFDKKTFEDQISWQQEANSYTEQLSFKNDTERIKKYGDLHYLFNDDYDPQLVTESDNENEFQAIKEEHENSKRRPQEPEESDDLPEIAKGPEGILR